MLIPQRPHTRDDGIPTRIDATYSTKPEIAIAHAVAEVEKAGGSPALTDAITMLQVARGRVADHIEGLPEAEKHFDIVIRTKPADGGEKLYDQAELDAAVAEAVDRDRITNFLLFARNLPEGPASLVYGTNLSAKAVARALEKAGYK